MEAGGRYIGDGSVSAALDCSAIASLGRNVRISSFAGIEVCCVSVIVMLELSLDGLISVLTGKRA